MECSGCCSAAVISQLQREAWHCQLSRRDQYHKHHQPDPQYLSILVIYKFKCSIPTLHFFHPFLTPVKVYIHLLITHNLCKIKSLRLVKFAPHQSSGWFMRLVQTGCALGTGRWCWRSEYQDQGTDQPQLSGSGLVSADNTNNPSDVQVDWMADGRSRHPNRCKQQMANCLKHFLLLCTGTPLLTTWMCSCVIWEINIKFSITSLQK